MNNAANSRMPRFAGILLICLLAGCTPTLVVYKAPETISVPYPNVKKIPLTVELRLNEELLGAQWPRECLSDKCVVIPLGAVLSEQAESMSRKLFTGLIVAKSAADGAPTKSDAILSPKPVAIERTLGATAFSDSVLTVVLEWTMKDANGRPVWVDATKGHGVAKSGNAFTHSSNATDQIGALVKDLFLKSYRLISGAKEIRALAQRRR